MPLCEICGKNQAVIYATRLEQGKPIYQGVCLPCAYKNGYVKFGGLDQMLQQFGVTEENVDEVQAQLNEFIGELGDKSPQEVMRMMMNGETGTEIDEIMKRFAAQMTEGSEESMAMDQEPEEADPVDEFIDDYLESDGKMVDSDFDPDRRAAEAQEEAALDPKAMLEQNLIFDPDSEDDAFDFDDELTGVEDDQDGFEDSDEPDHDDYELGEFSEFGDFEHYVDSHDDLGSYDDGDSDDEDESEDSDDSDDEGPQSDLELLDNDDERRLSDDDSGDEPDDGEEGNAEGDSGSDSDADSDSEKNPGSSDEEAPDFESLIPSTERLRYEMYAEQADENPDFEDAGEATRAEGGSRRRGKRKQEQLRHLRQFGKNLNESYINGEIDPLIGRESELKRVIQILNRRSKNNPVLLGEPGVGKTAIAEGLAGKIVRGEVPAKLLNMELYLLDLTAMVAGTQFRGQFESRMKAVVDDAMRAGNVILVIDELHNIMGAGDAEGAMNAANILKPALAKGQIRVLGSTTLDEYRRFIEKDHALERRFQQVLVEEPSREQAIEILRGVKPYYESHHFVYYPEEVLVACVDLSIRYINDRYLPDKAIDIMDEAGSLANLHNQTLAEVVKLRETVDRSKMVLDRLKERQPEEGQENRFYELQAETRSRYLQANEQYNEKMDELQPTTIGMEDVAKVVETWTGIPVSRVTQTESERLLNLEKTIHERLVGQDEAVNALARAIRRNRAGLQAKKRPASFIFVGPTGVGKTEMVKALSVAMFDKEDSFIRVDMSEYMEAHTVSKLIGSPPGYVGYDDGGQLTEKVRRHPYSILLLDEIEKAHPDVFNILLQILDDGRLTDSQGRVVDFSNTIVIMTSNAGTSNKAQGMGFGQDGEIDLQTRVQAVMKETFRPEFLNRIDEIIVFHHLKKSEIREIVDLMLADVQKGLAERGLRLQVSSAVKDYLAEKGYDPAYGARPLRRTITRLVEDPLSDRLLRGELEGKGVVELRLVQKKVDGSDETKPQIEFVLYDAQKSADE